ncbi:hypothetical protein [Bacillus sp. Marseille-P3661]|uniref:hypothetical protein n=1 Tax=Bacillus sp. Marseille-P3661 TaxID=1936234 RepID=UPI000C82E415|nr:hypothetical protein [Bacillus sp. Marseille-P3661]
MATLTKLMSLSVTIISLIAGVLSFYIMSDSPKEQKKRQIEEITSQLINFIIFVWISKVILNISIFISDPLAILAYPSDSSAFYLAILISVVFLFYKSKRGQLDMVLFIQAFIPIFLTSSFLYEFLKFILDDNALAVGRMVLLAILLVLSLFQPGIMVMLVSWTVGMFILVILQPYVTVFGYIMAPWFLAVFFVAALAIHLVNQRKRDCDVGY